MLDDVSEVQTDALINSKDTDHNEDTLEIPGDVHNALDDHMTLVPLEHNREAAINEDALENGDNDVLKIPGNMEDMNIEMIPNEENSFTKPEKDNKVNNANTREHKQVGTRLSSGNTLVSLAQASVHKKSLGSNLPHPKIEKKDDLKLTKDALKTAIEEEDSDNKEGKSWVNH